MTQADSSRPVPVAIIGMGCLFPMADGLERYWSNIRGRLDAITEVPPTHWRPEDYFDQDPKAADRTYAHRGGFLSPVDFPLLDFGIAPHTVEATDTTQLLGLLVARKALEDAGYGAGRDYARDRVSVILGVTGTLELVIPLGARLGHPIWKRALDEAGVDKTTADDVVRRISDSYVGWQENSFPGLLGNVAAGRIANRLDLGGANCVVDAACASSLGAVNLAMHELASGRCDVALSGGLDTFNDIFMYMCFSKTPALSPSGDARPFAASGDGTILGEGLGVVVLKRLDDARRDGDRIYAVIRSMGASSDGKGQSIYAPVASGQVKALRQAYELAGVTPDSIELIEAHGTGTKVGDGVEVEALEQVYGGARPDGRWCALGSVKSQIGHAKAAAGAAGLIKAALALHHKVLPPTIKVDRPIDRLAGETSPFYINADNRPWVSPGGRPRRAAVSAFGFGGSNFHCLLEEAEPDRKAVDWGGDVQILAYSADDPRTLETALPRWTEATSWTEVRAEAARSRSGFRSSNRLRLVIVARRGDDDLPGLIDEAHERLKSTPKAQVNGAAKPIGAGRPAARRVFFGEGDAPGRLAFLFPGQGSQYVGMLRDAACRFPRMLSALEAADAAATTSGPRLSDRIYPPSAFSDDDRRRQDEALRDTRTAQPAIGAVSRGLLQILADFGVRPDMAAGHSFGELTALHAAGRIDAESLGVLANERGALMADCASGTDSGAMLAVFATADQLADFIRRNALDVVVANKNAPRQCVVSGPGDEIERAERLLSAEKVAARRLPVSAAFHSRFVAKAREPLRRTLDGVEVSAGTIPVFANSTGAPYPSSADEARDLLADQLARPVEFTAMIDAMHRDGARTFVEVGPDAKLSGLTAAILEGKHHTALAVDLKRGEGGDLIGLAKVLANLAALGHTVDLPQWDLGYQPPPVASKRSGLTVLVSGAHPRPTPKSSPAPTPAPVAKPSAKPKTDAPPRLESSPPRTNQQTAPVERTMNSSHNLAVASSNGHTHNHTHSRLPEPHPSAPAPVAVAPPSLAPVFQQTHDHLIALQQLAQQTARLHQQFLEGQDTTQRTFQALLEQQLRLGESSPRLIAAPAPQRPAVVHQPVAPAPKAVKPAPVPTPAPIPVKAPAPVAVPATSRDDEGGTAEVLLAVVADKTGYPADMLELDMQLDADLGIDSIKRVEILSALQDRLPDAPPVRPDQLGTIRSLRDIVALLDSGTTPAAPVVASTCKRETPCEPPKPARLDRLTPRPHAIDAPDAREKVRLAAGGEVWITDDGSALTTALETALADRGLRGRVIALADADAAALEPAPCGLIVLAPAVGVEASFVKDAFQLIRAAGPLLRSQAAKGGEATLMTVSRLDGAFGLEGLEAAVEPITGGLAGLSKTASWEWPEVHCKAVDLDRNASNVGESARRIVEELFRRGPAEVGLSADRTIEVALDRVEWLSGNHRRRPVVDPGDLVVITGGARGITAEAAVALAAEFRPRLLLLGRTPVPVAEPEWLAEAGDEAAIRNAVRRHATEPMTPQKLNERGRQIIAQREIRRNLDRISQAGGEATYRSVDVRDAAAVRTVIEQIQSVHGPVRGLIHAAGVLADRRIDDQTDAQFAQVYDTKIDGLNAVFEAIDPNALRVLTVFSSSTARFGRNGQVAYAAANEVLNKWAQVQARRLPECRVVSFNWGPWDGGMVTSALRPLFESEGVGLIPLVEGARLVVREIQESRENPVEVVVLADPPGADDPEAETDDRSQTITTTPERPASDDLRPVFERLVDVDSLPVLRSHVIDGHAVLPMALIMEWLSESAVHRHPGLVVEGIDDLRLFKGVVLRDHRPVAVTLHAGKGTRHGATLAVPVEMRGALEGGREVVHARAVVRLGERHIEGRRTLAEGSLLPLAADRDEIYERSLFHGPEMQAIERIEGCGEQAIAAWASTAPAPGAWMAKPLRQQWLTDPLAIDAAFQLMILWCLERTGAGSLPTAVGAYRQFRRRFPDDGVRIVALVRESNDRRAIADVEFLDARNELVARMESYECVIDASLNAAFRRNRLTHLETAANGR